MRIELECLAATWLPLRLPQAVIDELGQILRDHSEAIDNSRYREIFRLDELFHSRLNAHCGNPHLEEMIDLMSDHGLKARWSAEMTSEFLNEVRDEHMEILDAIKACDQERLVITMRTHNVRGIDWFFRALHGYIEPFDAPDQFIGKAVNAARCGVSGKLANAVRWADMEHRRPALHARRTSLHATCGHEDHGAKCA